ncbi:12142_t:CDS:1, partial [Acaulospora colombiana]
LEIPVCPLASFVPNNLTNSVRLKSSLKAGHLLMTCQYWLPTDLVFPVRPLALFVLNRAIEKLWRKKNYRLA